MKRSENSTARSALEPEKFIQNKDTKYLANRCKYIFFFPHLPGNGSVQPDGGRVSAVSRGSTRAQAQEAGGGRATTVMAAKRRKVSKHFWHILAFFFFLSSIDLHQSKENLKNGPQKHKNRNVTHKVSFNTETLWFEVNIQSSFKGELQLLAEKKSTKEDEEEVTSSGTLIRTGRQVSQQKRQASLFGRKSLIDLLPFQKHEVCHLWALNLRDK